MWLDSANQTQRAIYNQKCVNKREAIRYSQKWWRSTNPCNAASLIEGQESLLLAGVKSILCRSSLCIRNVELFILCPICDGGYVTMIDIGSNDNLKGESLIGSFF